MINWVGKVHLLGHIFTSDDGFPWRSVRGRPQKSLHARFFHRARFDPRGQRASGKVTWCMYRFDSDSQRNANATPSNPRQWKGGLTVEGGGLGFGAMVRMSVCKPAVGVCVGSNPLEDSHFHSPPMV